MDLKLISSDVAKEVLAIILNCDSFVKEKIPEDILIDLNNLAESSSLEIRIDKAKTLDEQNLSDEALDTFALMYYLYVADDKEKDEILACWVMNDKESNNE